MGQGSLANNGSKYADPAAYYREMGKVAAKFAYATPKRAMIDVRAAMEMLCERDPRMMAALGRAMQLLVGSSVAEDDRST